MTHHENPTSGEVTEHHQHHEELVAAFKKELQPLFDGSAQPFYIYLDDHHKAGNQKVAEMLGYSSAEDWSKTDVNFVETFIAPESQDLVPQIYHDTIVGKLSAAFMDVTFQKKDGSKVKTRGVGVPIFHDGHFFTLIFIIASD
jgi:PAS domain S-box-containing protein